LQSSKNSIILVSLSYGFNQYTFDYGLGNANENLGLGYLKSSLSKKGIQSTIIDAPAMQLDLECVLALVYKLQPTIIGLSIINETLEISETFAHAVKKFLPNAIIVLGGHLPTNAPEEVLENCKAFDIVVRGYGEDTFCELSKAILNKEPYSRIKGLAIRVDGVIKLSDKRDFNTDLDSIPFPDRTAVAFKIQNGYMPTARLITSRGCPYNCTYCTTPAFMDSHNLQNYTKWAFRSPKNVVDEIQSLYNNLGVKVFILCDDEYVARPLGGLPRTIEIASEILQRKLDIKYWAMFRVDDFTESSKEMLMKIKESGLWGVFLGVETGSNKQLSVYGKGTSVEQNAEAVKLFKDLDILVEIGAITFHPEISMNELAEINDFYLKIGEASLFWHYISKLSLFPGTDQLTQEYRDKGLIDSTFSYKNINDFHFSNPIMKTMYQYLTDNYNLFAEVDRFVWSIRRLNTVLAEVKSTNIVQSQNSIPEIRKSLVAVDDSIGLNNHRLISSLITLLEANAESIVIKKTIKDFSNEAFVLAKNYLPVLLNLYDMQEHWKAIPQNYMINRFFTTNQWFDIKKNLL
jgi:radical SAM superfamily enzyme YgiQ (UPF0313 family)